MLKHQQDFIEFAIAIGALSFGRFSLKSGRISPYFFNAGVFNSGLKLAKLAQVYAATIETATFDFDVLFGPAYKGIPLAASTATCLAEQFGHDVDYAFNRKEAKDHGEGGQLVGADITGKKVLIIDDVITAGTAIREAIQLLEANQAQLAGIVISLDRQERSENGESALQTLAKQYEIPIIAAVTIDEVFHYLKTQTDQTSDAFQQHLENIAA